MDPLAAKLILDELRKLRDEFDAWFAKQDAALETSKSIPVLTQSAAVRADVVADNWGGLFDGDGDDDSVEQQCKAPIVADNWGGLFEQPTHEPEERDLGLSVIDVFGSAQIRNEHGLNSTVPVVHEPAPVLDAASAVPDVLIWWAFIWATTLGLVKQLLSVGAPSVIYKRAQGQQRGGINQIIRYQNSF